MKASLAISLLVLFISPFSQSLYSQDSKQGKKLYLHTDRELYFLGDTIYFKGYYLEGHSHQSVSGVYSMYSELIDVKGKAIQSQVFPAVNGMAAGRLLIPDTLEAGEYVIRAFTDLQRDLGEELFFHKKVKISSAWDNEKQSVQNPSWRSQKIDVAFMPEGGFLLAGQMNVVGVKAIDESGRSISVHGRILDEDGLLISNFATTYSGMDTIQFKALEQETYRVEIEGYPDFSYEFSDIKKRGIKLEFIAESRYELLFRGTTNSKQFIGKNYVFAIMHRGQVILQERFELLENHIPIKVNRSMLHAGINRFVLLDDQLRPISERLFFIRDYELNNIAIHCDRDTFETRSSVQLEILDDPEIGGMTISSLSLAVVDERTVGDYGSAMNILSYLLLDSELKGTIEFPSDYFLDDSTISSKSKLDLLMLTHGWSRYIWNEFDENEKFSEYEEKEGFSISGNVIRNFSKQAIANGKVNLSLYNNDGVFTQETKTDINGMFSFDRLHFADTASIFLQAWNEKEKSFRRVDINPIFMDNPTISRTHLPTPEVTLDIPKELQRQKYYNDMSLREYTMKTGSFLIEEVEVVSKKGDGIERTKYSKPATSLKVSMADYSYGDVFNYLRGRVPGLVVSYRKTAYGPEKYISIRGGGTLHGSSDVLFLLNGMPVSSETIQYLSLAQINVIDVLKSAGEASIFGISGANGVVAVYTKRGPSEEEWNANPVGVISEKICGYSPYREFYSPAYSPENIDTERPDHRMTLYWNPNIITENGKASVSFFTSDDDARYKIFVEGITDIGEICIGSAEIVVK